MKRFSTRRKYYDETRWMSRDEQEIIAPNELVTQPDLPDLKHLNESIEFARMEGQIRGRKRREIQKGD